MAKKKQLIVLCLDARVAFVPNGVSEAELKKRLLSVIDEAYKNGTITGDSGAEIQALHQAVCNKNDKRPPAKKRKPRGKYVCAGGLLGGERILLEDGEYAGETKEVEGVAVNDSDRVEITFEGGGRYVCEPHEEVLVV